MPKQVTLFIKRLLPLLILYFLFRILFILLNNNLLHVYNIKDWIWILLGGIRFDISGALYTMSVLALSHLVWYRGLLKGWFHQILKFIYAFSNTLFFMLSLMDLFYFKFNLKRSGWDALVSLGNVSAELKIQMLKEYWFLPIVVILLYWFFGKLYDRYAPKEYVPQSWYKQLIGALIIIGLFLIGVRGGVQLRPLDENVAFQYAESKHVPAVLNTPLVLLTSMTRPGLDPVNFFTDQRCNELYPMVQQYKPKFENKRNIVLIIMEGCSQEWLQTFNPKAKSVLPFLDSLALKSSIWTNMYSNAKRSAEGITAILTSIPALMEAPFPLSIYQANQVEGIGKMAKNQGYATYFSHGAHKGSLGLEHLAKQAGFEKTHCMDDYPNKGDYDGTWGIWDEPYFHFFLRETSKLPEPFLATIFTLSSHHPYVLPPGIKSNPKLNEVENTFSYLDFSIKSYFSEAQKQSWYQQSIFIILSDHSTPTADPIFGTAIGSYRIPLLVFDPQNPNPNVQKQLAQQIDILPLMAKFVGYTKPILSFGKDPEDLTKSWAYNFQSGNFRFITDSLWYISDNNMELKEIFDAKKDPKMQKNIIEKQKKEKNAKALDIMKAIRQQYNNRMRQNKCNYDKNEN